MLKLDDDQEEALLTLTRASGREPRSLFHRELRAIAISGLWLWRALRPTNYAAWDANRRASLSKRGN